MAIEANNRHRGATPAGQMPLWTHEEVRSLLRTYDRTPFIDLLAQWMQCAPSLSAITKLAEEKPAVYMGALRALATMAGFTERRELDVTHHVDVKKMSDSQLEDKLIEMAASLHLPPPTSIDAKDIIDVTRPARSEPPAPSASPLPDVHDG